MGPALLTVGVVDASAEVVGQVGAIWARARNRRDGTAPPSATDCEDAASGVRRRLALDGATVLLARRDDDVVGFALFAPNARAIEVFYLAVHPDVWRTGVAHALLREVDGTVRAWGRTSLELWVVDDNARAIGVYERAGYASTEDRVTDPTSGRIERRLVRDLG